MPNDNNDNEDLSWFYTIIPPLIYFDKILTADEKLFYGALNSNCASNGRCYYSASDFASALETDETVIQKWLAGLSAYVKVEADGAFYPILK
jgi:hypothetical protein